MNKSILYVNACVRNDSRTQRLAEKLLSKLCEQSEEVSCEEVRLEEIAFPTSNKEYLKLRDQLIAEGDLQNPMFDLARQFAEAETIVIAAPYWDLSFPAMLKQYLENINVVDITFRYSEEGIPIGLCRAKRLFYVSTAGGCYVPEEYGFGYVKALAQNYYGIQDVRQIRAVGLDIIGADVDAIMGAAEASLSGIDLS
jgi:FMN-dependent NADH-azoreductase